MTELRRPSVKAGRSLDHFYRSIRAEVKRFTVDRQQGQLRLPNSTITVASIGAWTEQTGCSATLDFLRSNPAPKFVVAGNDVMALGVVRALREIGKTNRNADVKAVQVIGYDGIARALYAIAEPDNPFAATIRTPPAAYGHEIAAMILSDSRSFFEKGLLKECVIPVGQGQLVVRDNVDMFLDA